MAQQTYLKAIKVNKSKDKDMEVRAKFITA